MVYLTRYLIGLLVKTEKFNKHTNLFIGYKENSKNIFDKIDFVKNRKKIYIAVSLIIAKVLDITVGLRVKDNEEITGLDSALHEESGYRI